MDRLYIYYYIYTYKSQLGIEVDEIRYLSHKRKFGEIWKKEKKNNVVFESDNG